MPEKETKKIKKSIKIEKLLIAAVLLIFILVVVGKYLLVKPNQRPETKSKLRPTATLSKAQWIKHTGLLFSIEHPSNWTIEENQTNDKDENNFMVLNSPDDKSSLSIQVFNDKFPFGAGLGDMPTKVKDTPLKVIVEGKTYNWKEVTYEDNNPFVVEEMIKNDKKYVVNFSASSESEKNTILKMLSTLQIN